MNAERCDEKGDTKIGHCVIVRVFCCGARKRSAGCQPTLSSFSIRHGRRPIGKRTIRSRRARGCCPTTSSSIWKFPAARSFSVQMRTASDYGLIPQACKSTDQSGRISGRPCKDGVHGRSLEGRLCRSDLRGLPRGAVELQRQTDSYRRRRGEHVRFHGICPGPG